MSNKKDGITIEVNLQYILQEKNKDSEIIFQKARFNYKQYLIVLLECIEKR